MTMTKLPLVDIYIFICLIGFRKSHLIFHYKCRKNLKFTVVHAVSVIPKAMCSVFVNVERLFSLEKWMKAMPVHFSKKNTCSNLNYYLTGWTRQSQFQSRKSIYRENVKPTF
jgi:hypothetical protein